MSSEFEIGSSTGSDQVVDRVPAWDLLTVDILCPCCGYNLRELTVNRCPECGGHFRWEEEIEKAKLRENPLFEFQFKYRPVYSYFKTCGWLLCPWIFWRRVPVLLPTQVLPLSMLVLATLILCGASLTGLQYLWRWIFVLRFSRPPGNFLPGIGYYIEYYSWHALPIVAFIFLIWLALQVFWQTRRSHRIRQRQLLRVLIYSLTTLLLSGVATECLLQLINIAWGHLRWLAGWINVPYLSSYVGLFWFLIAFTSGIRVQLGMKQCCRMTLILLFLTLLLITFLIIQSGLYYGTLEPFRNPIVGLVAHYLPKFWLLFG